MGTQLTRTETVGPQSWEQAVGLPCSLAPWSPVEELPQPCILFWEAPAHSRWRITDQGGTKEKELGTGKKMEESCLGPSRVQNNQGRRLGHQMLSWAQGGAIDSKIDETILSETSKHTEVSNSFVSFYFEYCRDRSNPVFKKKYFTLNYIYV